MVCYEENRALEYSTGHGKPKFNPGEDGRDRRRTGIHVPSELYTRCLTSTGPLAGGTTPRDNPPASILRRRPGL